MRAGRRVGVRPWAFPAGVAGEAEPERGDADGAHPGDRARWDNATAPAADYRSLTCEDFITAGGHPPANCVLAGHP